MSVIEPLRPRGSSSGGAAHIRAYRFGIGAGGSDWRWHAVDMEAVGRRDVEMFSVCGTRSELVPRLGQFTYDSRWLSERRCERCGWVVALNRGTVEAEIELHVGAAGNGDTGLLRQIFTSILADVAPGRDAESGHRSDLLAHAARHRPTVIVCEECGGSPSAAEVHGKAWRCARRHSWCAGSARSPRGGGPGSGKGCPPASAWCPLRARYWWLWPSTTRSPWAAAGDRPQSPTGRHEL